MEIIDNLLLGFSVALTLQNLLFAFIGVTLGTIIGALPGLGPSTGVALLIPVTITLEPTSAIIMLAGMYYGAMYGGALTSILVNIPGDSAAVMTTLDGHQMALGGRAGQALGISAISSFIAGTLSVVGLMFAAPALAEIAVTFGAPEYFALILLGLTTLAGLTGTSTLKGLLVAVLGLLVGTVGIDTLTSESRFTYGNTNLFSGIDFLPVAIGLFGIAEVLANLDLPNRLEPIRTRFRDMFPTRQDLRDSGGAIGRGTILGFFVGILPGAGATIASFLSYALEKRVGKHRDQMGKGAVAGVAAPEAANNAASSGALIPMLVLGIPGSATTAVLLGALLLQDVQPGPLLLDTSPEIFWALVASMYIGNLMLIMLNLPLAPLFASVLRIPYSILMPIIMGFALVGAYSLRNNVFDIGIAVFFGLVGYLMKRFGYPAAPFILALVLGPLLEENFRRSLQISEGSLAIFYTNPLTLVLLLISFAAVVGPPAWGLAQRTRQRG